MIFSFEFPNHQMLSCTSSIITVYIWIELVQGNYMYIEIIGFKPIHEIWCFLLNKSFYYRG